MTENDFPKVRIYESRDLFHTHSIRTTPFKIGRHGDNDLKVSDPSVSRYHMEIIQQNDQYMLVDRGSKSGTHVNNLPVQTCVLKHSDKIQFGNAPFPQMIFMTRDEDVTDHFHTGDSPSAILASAGKDLQNISRLLESARLLSGSLSFEEVLDLVLDIAIEVCKAERGFVVLKDEEGNPRFQRGRNEHKISLPEESFQVSRSVLNHVMSKCVKVFLMDDKGTDIPASQSIINLELRTIVCLPLKKMEVTEQRKEADPGGQVLGALYLDSKIITEHFSKISEGILDSLAADVSAVIENVRLLKAAREKDRLEVELATAQQIQAALLPKIEGNYEFFQACARNIPSRHISGDYYDLIKREDGSFGFVIADVAGKGVSAAIMSSMIQGTLYAESSKQVSPAECLTQVNRYLVHRTASNRFVTLFFGVLTKDGQLTYVNAGHNCPLLVSTDGTVQELFTGDVLLGAFGFADYHDKTMTLSPGDLLFLYTDGLTEAANEQGEMFGEERVEKLVVENRDKDVEELLDLTFATAADYSAGTQQSDDLTIMVLRYTG